MNRPHQNYGDSSYFDRRMEATAVEGANAFHQAVDAKGDLIKKYYKNYKNYLNNKLMFQ